MMPMELQLGEKTVSANLLSHEQIRGNRYYNAPLHDGFEYWLVMLPEGMEPAELLGLARVAGYRTDIVVLTAKTRENPFILYNMPPVPTVDMTNWPTPYDISQYMETNEPSALSSNHCLKHLAVTHFIGMGHGMYDESSWGVYSDGMVNIVTNPGVWNDYANGVKGVDDVVVRYFVLKPVKK